MERFSSEWLALRESADHAARAPGPVRALAGRLATARLMRAVDLAAGTGSNVRYLLPRLPAIAHWTLVDHDAALLAEAWRRLSPVAQQAGRSFDVRAGDLRDLDTLALDGASLVTGSALLDLVSEAWLRGLAARCRAAGVAVLFALSYDGAIDCTPVDDWDGRVRELVNAHQRTDKGFGPALGPDAAAAATRILADEGYVVTTAASDWALGVDARELQAQLVGGWAGAAAAIAPGDAPAIDAWRRRRLEHVSAGRSTIRVGHVDLAGWLA